MIKGAPKFNGIAIGTMSVNANGNQLHLEATAGFVDSRTGETHGWTRAEGRVWSKATMLKLRELMNFMEEDLAKIHFGEARVASAGTKSSTGIDVVGLSEHLSSDGVQSV